MARAKALRRQKPLEGKGLMKIKAKAFRRQKCMGVNPWGDGGDASPQFLEWGDEYLIIPPPPHTLFDMLMKFCFLVILKT
jgi:hypothetical protein